MQQQDDDEYKSNLDRLREADQKAPPRERPTTDSDHTKMPSKKQRKAEKKKEKERRENE